MKTTTHTFNKNAIALTAALGLFPVVLDSTIVNVALIPISRALSTDFNTIQWISVGYLLANAAVVSLSGYLGNRFGVKRLFSLGIIIFGLCSFLCGIAPDINWLIALRVIQGIGGGMLLPLGMAIALQPFAKEERIKAMAIVGIPLMAGPVLGPIVGGLIIDNLNWQAIFFINVPLCVLAVALSWLYVPKDEADPATKQTSFDYLGLLLSTLGIVAIVYAFKLVGQRNPDSITALNPAGDIYGWAYWQVWLLLGIGLLLLSLFVVRSLFFSADPVLDVRLFKHYDFAISNLVSWVSATVTFGVMALVPQFLQQVRLPNLSAFDTGLAMMPLGLAVLVGMIICRKLYNPVGPRILVIVGGLLLTVSFWQMDNLTPTTSGSDLWPWLTLMGLSISLTAVPVQTLATEGLSGAALTKGTSLVTATKSIFGAVGPSILVTFLVQQSTHYASQLKADYLQKLPVGAVPNPTSPALAQVQKQLAAQAQTSGLNDIFSILIFVSLGIVLIGLALPGRAKAKVESPEAAAPSELVTL
jgi:EmrB/QacA subfamily drug resistance transporter